MMKKNFLIWLIILAGAGVASAQPDMKETLSVIQSSLAKSRADMQYYSWVETIRTWVDNELKSTKENQCYYSVDGKLVKIATGNSDQPKTPGGIRGKIIENKKEALSEYIDKSLEKIREYLPPDGDKLQKIYDGGKVGIQILSPGKQFKLSFPDYLQQGDLLSISVDIAEKKLIALSVSTWIDKPEEMIVFDVTYKILPDGTQYTALTDLQASAKNLKIEIEESGFRKGSGN
ncbi:MAG: hypothetical protein JXA23_06390 [Bacteroidales bacterium]|nr:hypothetical protein [Bacteroidales bacterium]